MKNEKKLSENFEIKVKYLNNVIEQNRRSIKWIITLMLSFQAFCSVNKTLKDIEAMNRLKRRNQIGQPV